VLFASRKVDDTLWEIVNENLRFFLSSPGAQQWWRSQPLGLHRQFVESVESEVLGPGTGETSSA
jgi:hypothetical protein